MHATIGLLCGHYAHLLDPSELPPDDGPCTLWTDSAAGVDDEMTCLTCGSTLPVRFSVPDLLPLDSDGNLS